MLDISNVNFSTAYGGWMELSCLTVSSIMADNVDISYASISSLAVSSIRGDTLDISNVNFSTAYGGWMELSCLTVSSLMANNVDISKASISSIYGNNAYFSTAFISTFGFGTGYGNSLSLSTLNVSSLSGVGSTMYSTFSTYYFSTGYGLNLYTSTMNVSTIMGVDLPIFTFDMVNRRVGVNLGATQQPRATMDISGIVYANCFVTTSDKRLKRDIQLLEPPTIIPNAYRYLYSESGISDIGVMADEIQELFPECVYIRPDGFKAVSYDKLVPVCLTLIKSLSERIDKLEQRR